MSTDKIKEDIQKALNEVPEGTLNDILVYINNLKTTTGIDPKRHQYLNKILKEDHEVLKRLAQ